MQKMIEDGTTHVKIVFVALIPPSTDENVWLKIKCLKVAQNLREVLKSFQSGKRAGNVNRYLAMSYRVVSELGLSESSVFSTG